ncbi:MAG: glycosyltransferase [Oscillospiraceae bacterium]|nr:glycosyltransferase [Oscillospiraceae bacterium]
MIFVTVGTHEQPFNRLVKYMDMLKKHGRINEEIIIQTGFSTYEPQFCEWSKLYPYEKMTELISEARIVITHGGPSSFIMPLQIGKIPVVVPRQFRYNEHVNNHQVEFSNAVAERQGNIIVVEDIKKLGETILNYDNIIKSMPAGMKSNNVKFNCELEKIVSGMFRKKGKK